MKYTFEIQHVAEMEVVRFTITAETKEKALWWARLLNPEAKLIEGV